MKIGTDEIRAVPLDGCRKYTLEDVTEGLKIGYRVRVELSEDKESVTLYKERDEG